MTQRETFDDLFERILKSGMFKKTKSLKVINRKGKRKIIIIEDVHSGSPDPEDTAWISQDLTTIFTLLMQFRIPLIGIEGWAGEAIDKKRGHMIINGERPIVQFLVQYCSDKVIGLEGELEQRNALMMLIKYAYSKFTVIMRDLVKSIKEEKVKEFENLIEGLLFNLESAIFSKNRMNVIAHYQGKMIALQAKGGNDTEREDIGRAYTRELREIHKEIEKPEKTAEKIANFLHKVSKKKLKEKRVSKQIQILIKESFLITDVLLELFPNELLSRKKTPFELVKSLGTLPVISEKKGGIKFSGKEFKVAIQEEREKVAAQKFIEEMQARNVQAGIIFFGVAHTKGLIKNIQTIDPNTSILIIGFGALTSIKLRFGISP